MIPWIHKWLEVFNVKGGPLMGLWSLLMIVLTASGIKIDPVARDVYLGALAVYGVSKGHALRLDAQSKVTTVKDPHDV
ncbi:MAG TPA: hypothetical protein DCS05_04260 [Nitrospiraceae bacterium]|nr:hypothetical protein [Nitrospiraceae bacterium]